MGTHFTALSAYSFMIFNLLCAPCFAAMGAIKREMNNARWTLGAIGYMCGFAYVVSLIVYQLGGLITGEVSFGIGTIAAAAALVGLVYLLVRRNKYDENTLPHFRRCRRGQVRSAYECTNNYHWPDHFGRVCGHCGKGHLQPPPWQELLLLRGAPAAEGAATAPRPSCATLRSNRRHAGARLAPLSKE